MIAIGGGLVKTRIVLWTVWYLLSLILGKDPSSLPKPSEEFPYREGRVNFHTIRTQHPRSVINPGDGWRLQRAVEAARARVHEDSKKARKK